MGTIAKVANKISELESKLEPFLEAEQEPPKDLMWELIHYQKLYSRLKVLVELVDDSWVSELNDPEKWQFRPTRVRSFGHLLTGHSQQMIAMSATLLSAKDFAWNLGIDDDIPFYRVKSTFPKEHRRVIPLSVADFSLKSATDESLLLMLRMFNGLLDKHKVDKGIAHTTSYKLARYLLENSRHHNRLISHSEAGTRSAALQKLIDSEAPLVLVSPSFGRGVDLFGDRARFQIICKIPFPDLGDKQTAKRRWSGKSGER